MLLSGFAKSDSKIEAVPLEMYKSPAEASANGHFCRLKAHAPAFFADNGATNKTQVVVVF
jgi:hypothetical protein